ncbi:alpha-hydroxy-acid oxidizing protein, partial [Aestuariivirga sp.]|uniref:alpha-hydroxy-acid oxidizing protein n=1 Tax=Aestuariivirga sp. TaxID=2650926 RepID=UPI00378502CB
CVRFSGRPAYRIDGQWITWADCARRVGLLAARIIKDIRRPDREDGVPVVAALLHNSPLLLELFYAATLGGFALLPLNHRLSAGEIDEVLETAAAELLVTSTSLLPKCETLAWCRANIGRTLCDATETPRSSIGARWLEQLPADALADGSPRTPVSPLPVEVFATSGSTGKVKIVPHTDEAVLVHARATMAALGLTAEESHCWAHAGPMFHVGDVAFVWIGLLIGARHVFIENQLQLDLTARTLASEGVTITKLAPSMLALLTQSHALEGMRFPSLKWLLTGGARLDPGLAAQAAARLGCEVLQGYGMTEATCHIAFGRETGEAGDAGLGILPGLEVRIVSESGDSLPTGEIGEIALRGPTVMRGYRRAGMREPDRSAFMPDGFLRTEDLGYITASGRLHVTGRVKDMINVGGENVFAAEVEQVAGQLPGIGACSAFALPDALLGEVVGLAIEGDGHGLSESEVRDHCRARLASYKVPKTVVFLAELPRTATGKIRKSALAELVQTPVPGTGMNQGEAADGALIDFLIARIQQHLGPNRARIIGVDTNILALGIDSLNVIDLLLELEKRYGLVLSPTLLYDYPTVGGLAGYLNSLRTSGMPLPSVTESSELPAASFGAVDGKLRAGSLVSWVLQGLGLLVRPSLVAAASIPVLVLAILFAQHAGPLLTLALSPLWVAAHLGLVVLLTALAVRLLDPRDASFPLWSARYCGWLAAQNLLRGQEDVLGLLRGTAALPVYYWLMGARIGARVRIETLGLTDPRFITLGDGVFIGREAVLQPARITAAGVTREPLQIGDGAAIGPGAQLVGETVLAKGGSVGTLGTEATTQASDVQADRQGSGLLGYLCAAYVYGLSVAAALMLMCGMADRPVAQLPGRLADVVLEGSPLHWRELLSVALTLQIVLPLISFLAVALLVRPLCDGLGRAGRSHLAAALYRSAIEVPFFAVWQRMTVMSPLSALNLRALGATVGKNTMLAGPYVEDPRHLRVGDGAIIAGNVTVLNGRGEPSAAAAVEVGRQSIVANSCILSNGAVISERTLLGDLSALSGAVRLPEGSVAVGPSARVVGRSRFHVSELKDRDRVIATSLLIPAQLLAAALISVLGIAIVAALLQTKLLPGMWNAAWALPVALLARRLVRVVALAGFKWLALGRVAAGEHPLMGGLHARWVFMEALITDAERAILVNLRGTFYLSALWRLLGAKVGRGACIMGSSLGCEFDLKSIGRATVLQPNAMVFAHSVEHHALSFRPTHVGDNVNVGPNTIVEAGAVVADGSRLRANMAIHARPAAANAESAARPDLLGGDPLALEQEARQSLPPAIFSYFANGSETGRALRRNLEVFRSIAICPRRLRDVSAVSLETRLFGKDLSSPILIAPSAMHRLLHFEGEMAVARAAARRNGGMVLSMLSTTSLEQVAKPFSEAQGLSLFQLYMLKDRGLTDALVQRAEAAGFGGLVVTVDSPASGRIDIDPREWMRFSAALELAHLPATADTSVPPLVRFEAMKDPALTFADLVALKARTRMPICLKGILSPADAVLAASLGFETLILSNHGGRRLDDEVSAIEMISQVRLALDRAGHDIRLLADGGIRHGADAFKAIALGADGVLVGRAPLWGLAAGGEAGVARVLQRLDDELVLTMKLAGCSSLAELTPDLLQRDSLGRATALP